MTLDRTDFGILRLLQKNASLSNKQIAAEVGLAPSSAHERLKRLHDVIGIDVQHLRETAHVEIVGGECEHSVAIGVGWR